MTESKEVEVVDMVDVFIVPIEVIAAELGISRGIKGAAETEGVGNIIAFGSGVLGTSTVGRTVAWAGRGGVILRLHATARGAGADDLEPPLTTAGERRGQGGEGGAGLTLGAPFSLSLRARSTSRCSRRSLSCSRMMSRMEGEDSPCGPCRRAELLPPHAVDGDGVVTPVVPKEEANEFFASQFQGLVNDRTARVPLGGGEADGVSFGTVLSDGGSAGVALFFNGGGNNSSERRRKSIKAEL